jgi:hypothetical protein
MRATAISHLLCVSVAFLLSMLVLFAGSSLKFLPKVDLLTVRSPNICLHVAERLG